MSRPKGSKNKPKVTTALVGEVINKPLTGKLRKEVEEIKESLDKKRDASGFKVVEVFPENGDKMVSEGAPAPVLSDDEINAATLKDAQQTVTRRRKLSVKDKSFQEQLDFLFNDMKSLRNYVSRLEDALNVKRNDITNEPEPIHKKRRGKVLTNQDTSDTVPVEKEISNETDTK